MLRWNTPLLNVNPVNNKQQLFEPRPKETDTLNTQDNQFIILLSNLCVISGIR